MKNLTTRHSFETIDNFLRENGYTISRDICTKSDITLRKDCGSSWDFERKFYSKSDLIEFANSLQD